MPIGSILLGIALAVLVAPFVAAPFVKRPRRKEPAQEQRESAEQARPDALLALRDLDFDFRTGKIAEEDYAPLRGRLMADAAAALQADAASQSGLDAEIEAAVRAAREKKRDGSACPTCGATAHAGSKFCPNCGATLAAPCPKCHGAIKTADKYCAHCGASLKLESVPAS